MEDKEKIGFFGGTFDPIHFGHITLVKQLAELRGLSRVWFCPARVNPHKVHEAAPLEHRLQMVRLALEEYPKFSVLDLEAKREGPSYTVDTLKEIFSLENFHPRSSELVLILSDETVKGFFHWKHPEEIVRIASLLIGSRYQAPFEAVLPVGGAPSIVAAIKKGWQPTEPLPISSSEIRKKLQKGEDCTRLVPKKVLDYIQINKLYC